MEMEDYWYGISYRTGAILVASIDLTYALIRLITGLLVILFPEYFLNQVASTTILFPINYLPEDTSLEKDALELGLISTISVFIAEFSLAILLFWGIFKRHPDKVGLWVKIRLLLLIIGTVGYVFEMTLISFLSFWNGALLTLVLIIGVGYRGYSIIIARSFQSDLLFMLYGYDLGLRLYESK